MNTTATQTRSSRVVIATTVALAFISFWRGSAIVLSDLASSMFYAGGVAEKAVGPAAPWFVLGVMFFSFALRSVYLEGCSMFVRGGVYVVVRDSMGPTLARFSVSALIFDYLLTGPISSVSAGHYISGLFNEISETFQLGIHISPTGFSVLFALIATLYFWRMNIKGIHESSNKALRILQITTIMVVIILVWCPVSMILQGKYSLPPAPIVDNLKFTKESLGWFSGSIWPTIAASATFIAFGHAFLSMSGFETLAQVYREIAYPKLKSLKLTGTIVCTYALISTGLITVFAGIIIPAGERAKYADNLISGLSMNLSGPYWLLLIFHAFVVCVGALILCGAVNTSLIGANGVLNRVAEDGVVTEWFRKPHQRYGTSSRIVSTIAILQIVTILLSRGDVYLLGEAYAFGVVWSFFMKSLGVLILRFQRHDQEYKVPFNLRVGSIEIPVGLVVITCFIFAVAFTNLFSKPFATIYGSAFTVGIFLLFTASERINAQRKKGHASNLEEFVLDKANLLTAKGINVRPGAMVVFVREPYSMNQLHWALERTNIKHRDIVVVTIRVMKGGGGYGGVREDFLERERQLFSKVVKIAEKAGKTVNLLVIPASNPIEAMVRTAANLEASCLVTGISKRMDCNEFARRIGLAWEDLSEPRHIFSLAVIEGSSPKLYVTLGPHPPRLWPEDVEKLHDLWLMLSAEHGLGGKFHHRDVLSIALQRLDMDLHSESREEILKEIGKRLKAIKKQEIKSVSGNGK